MPRPFWVVFWDPMWRPFWRPIRTGSPRAAETRAPWGVPIPVAARDKVVVHADAQQEPPCRSW
jgi:hypothetical protein